MNKPQTQEPMIKIDNVIDLELLQRLQDTFAKAMGVAAVTVDRQGILCWQPCTSVLIFGLKTGQNCLFRL